MEAGEVKAQLVEHYEAASVERDAKGLVEFRQDFRSAFAHRLRRDGFAELADLGAGTGHEGEWFARQGFAVSALDLSPSHVELCRQKGLDAVVGDFYELPWPDSRFPAIWCMSSVMHIPNADLGLVLDEFARVVIPGGLIAIGMWAGDDSEGIWDQDFAEPKRFYALRSEPTMRAAFAGRFEIVDLEHRLVDNASGWPYQFWIVRNTASDRSEA